MKKMTRKEVAEIASKIWEDYSKQMLNQAVSKYQDAVKERAINDVHNQNEFAKQNYPEKSYLSFNLVTGNFIVPYDTNSKLKLVFLKDDKKKEVELDTNDYKFDVEKLLKLCKEYDYCRIVCDTFVDFELFDEKEVENGGNIVKHPHQWVQTFEGFTRCSDVIAIYQNVAKIHKVEEAEA